MRRVLRLLLMVPAFVSPGFPANLTYVRLDQAIVESRLQLSPVDQAARVTMLRNQFLKAGCTPEHIVEQPVSGQAAPNLICTLQGTEPGSVVIAARSDFQSKGDEAKVDWATLELLPLLAESMYQVPHRYNLVFVAFTGHKELAGSATYLKSLTEDEQRSIRAMIDLDQVGRTPATYAFATVQTDAGISHVGRRPVANTITHDDTPMTRLLPFAAQTLKFSDAPEQNHEALVTDAQNFERAGTLALTITSPAYTTLVRSGNTMIHMARTELDPKVYYQTYNLLCVYTLYLDRGIAPPRSRTTTEAAAKVTNTSAAAHASSPDTISAAPVAPVPPPAAPTVSVANNVLPPTTAVIGASASSVTHPSAQTPELPTPTFRSTTRLVQVDVVVTDKAGSPITGLKQSDFSVYQDGKPQPVRAFEAHLGSESAQATKSLDVQTLPAGTYTNIPGRTPDQSWTIVLYDALNTPTQNQQDARKQLISVLKSMPAGQPVALFLLAQRLEMLQGFSTDPAVLANVAEKLNPNTSGLLTTEGQRESAIGHTAYAAAMSTPGQVGSNATVLKSGTVQRQLQGYHDMEALRNEQRILFTLDALRAMARAVSGYPGRKNLIWLSGSFQIRLEPAEGSLDPFRNVQGYEQNLTQTSTLLTESRVAVYPIDIRGLQTSGVDMTVSSTDASQAFVGPQTITAAGTSQGIAATTNDSMAGLLRDQSITRSNERESMTEAAYQTGGRAFVGTNDFAGAIKKAMADGSIYYTIAYTPPQQKDKAEPYHQIEVKLNRSDVNLSYRRGYYSSPQQHTTSEQGIAALQGALQPGMPPATMLYVMASVQPPNGKQKTVKINYIISPNNVTFSDLPENKKHVLVDCMAVAFDKDGKEVAHASDTLDGTIPMTAYEAIMRQGLPANQELQLKPGTYNLRLGVMDRVTQQIGTVDVPLEISQQVAGK